jgi:sulfite reductase (ferredoxin)
LTPQQNLYLAGIKESDRAGISDMLRQYGIAEPEMLPPVLRYAMSCPALPTCGQAITESERAMPGIVAQVQGELNRLGLSEQIVHLRTTGCPNGCARPYTAEIGIVGASVNMYTIYLGASPLGTRLGQAFATNVKEPDLVNTLRPVLELYASTRNTEEEFGDFCHRVGMEALKSAPELTVA